MLCATPGRILDTDRDVPGEHFNLADVLWGPVLGNGSFGVVHLVQWKGGFYACKRCVKVDIVASRQGPHVFRERSLLLQMAHPLTVRLRATAQDASAVYLLMDYLPGGDMYRAIYGDPPLLDRSHASGLIADGTVRFYASSFVEFIRYLHAHAVVYRDLKPDNAVLDSGGFPVFVDFAFSRSLPYVAGDGSTRSALSTVLGSAEYMAPEVAARDSYSFAVDVWAIGIIVFELLVGRPPFEDDNYFGLLEKVQSAPIEIPKHVGEAHPIASDLVLKCLVRDQTARATIRDVVVHEWFRDFDWDALRSRRLKPPFLPLSTAPDPTTWEPVAHESEVGTAVPVTCTGVEGMEAAAWFACF